MGRSNEALVRRAIEAIWNRYELDVADDLFGAEYVNHHGLIPDLVRGPEAIKVSVTLYRLAFPDLHIVVDALSTKGETVVLHWSARRRFPSRSGGSSPATPPELLTGITRMRMGGGRILESWTNWQPR